MSTPTCAHLHVHSEYSLLDGACKIEQLAARAAEFGQPALGLTDHGVMNGAVELFKACKKHGVKPILGLEAYFVDDRANRDGKPERNHLTLLARDDEGFRNLTKLSSAGFLEGLHRGKPGVDMELLARHSRGVIALSGCLASRSSRRIVEGRLEDARAHLDDLVQAFGPENVYFEIQRNGIAEQEQVNEAIMKFAREMGGRWSRPPTCTTCGARTTTTTRRCCACRRSRRSRRRSCRSTRTSSISRAPRSWRSRSPTCPRRSPRRSRSPIAATCRSSSAAS